ncbi:MAG: PEP-CTERM sorting domain-containing protein [Chthoniobacterales bacterium]|nr:PEP-CTERM sorting domain-containing protein [Chthoniobacterales bacterium]
MTTNISSSSSGKVLAAILAAILSVASANAAFLVVNLPGTTAQDNWTDLTATNYPGFPVYATSGNAWPSPIAATSGNGGGSLNKVSGLGFPSNGGGVYVGGMVSGTGTFAVTDSTAITGLETVVFQLEVEGVGANWNSVLSGLSLNYNGGSQALPFDFSLVVSAIPNGSLYGQPKTIFTLAYQWDLTSLGATSFNIAWTAAEHSVTSNLQMNQGDTMLQVVPEPATGMLLGLGVVALSLCWVGRSRREGME